CLLCSFSSYPVRHHRHLPSFPTRRSSDLGLREVQLFYYDFFGDPKKSETQEVHGWFKGGDRRGSEERFLSFIGLNVDSDLVKQSDRKSTRLNSSHVKISYAVFCLKKKR